jgi:hypothetical protein
MIDICSIDYSATLQSDIRWWIYALLITLPHVKAIFDDRYMLWWLFCHTSKWYSMIDICSIDYSATRQSDIRILSTYSANVIHRRWLWPMKISLDGTVASEVFHTFPEREIAWSEVRRSRWPRNGSRPFYHKQHCAFCTWDGIIFISIRSATHAWYIIVNVANEILESFFVVFKLFRVGICNRFENTLIYICPNRL